ncbi:hypothetical protein [Carboxylicivirga sp. N1Y90]|uniref:hypothetical protein n=1 Tax=Carboxylicivirga fragile TaxID=3417571 RepID=UPI003D34B95A|nr:hypothetical protein [Marinilabiliaceae bacterium N1Y90]
MEELLLEYKVEPTDMYYQNRFIRFYVDHTNNGEMYFFKCNRKKYFITHEEYSDLERSISGLKLVILLPDDACGCDGAWESLRIEKGFNSIEFKWWCDSAGDQWKGIYEIRDKIMHLKEKYADASDNADSNTKKY